MAKQQETAPTEEFVQITPAAISEARRLLKMEDNLLVFDGTFKDMLPVTGLLDDIREVVLIVTVYEEIGVTVASALRVAQGGVCFCQHAG